jgi:hypothetical protein
MKSWKNKGGMVGPDLGPGTEQKDPYPVDDADV